MSAYEEPCKVTLSFSAIVALSKNLSLKYIFLRKKFIQSLRKLSLIFQFDKKPVCKRPIALGFEILKNCCYSTATARDALVFIICHNRNICFKNQKLLDSLYLQSCLKTSKHFFYLRFPDVFSD